MKRTALSLVMLVLLCGTAFAGQYQVMPYDKPMRAIISTHTIGVINGKVFEAVKRALSANDGGAILRRMEDNGDIRFLKEGTPVLALATNSANATQVRTADGVVLTVPSPHVHLLLEGQEE